MVWHYSNLVCILFKQKLCGLTKGDENKLFMVVCNASLPLHVIPFYYLFYSRHVYKLYFLSLESIYYADDNVLTVETK